MSDNFIPLRDLALLITKGTTPTVKDGGFALSGVNYIKSECLSYEGAIDTSKFAFVTEDVHLRLKRSIIEEGDILYSIAGANLGKCSIARKEHLPANTNQAVAIIRIDPSRACNRFVSYVLRDPRFVQMVIRGVAQSAQPNVNLAQIGHFPIPSLSLTSQQAIASVLGALDDKIDLNRRMNETLEAMARAIFKDWFVDFGPTRAKMEGQAPYLAPEIWALFPDRMDNGGKPEGWRIEPLLNHARLISGGTPKTEQPAYWHGLISWASAKDVSQCREAFLVSTERSITERGLNESATRLVPQYATVVVARGATTGRFCMFGREMAMNQTCYGLASIHNRPFWLNCAFSRAVDALVHAAHGSVFDTITTKTIESAQAVIPSHHLLEEFEGLSTPLFIRALKNIEEIGTLTATRDLLLPKLMSGEIRVKDAEKIVETAA